MRSNRSLKTDPGVCYLVSPTVADSPNGEKAAPEEEARPSPSGHRVDIQLQPEIYNITATRRRPRKQLRLNRSQSQASPPQRPARVDEVRVRACEKTRSTSFYFSHACLEHEIRPAPTSIHLGTTVCRASELCMIKSAAGLSAIAYCCVRATEYSRCGIPPWCACVPPPDEANVAVVVNK